MREPAAGTRRTLAVLCLASAGWAFSFGLGAPLASLWLRDAGCGTTLLGLNTAVYYLAVALAAPALPRLMRRSARRCVLAGMLLSAAATALFPWCDGLAAWFGLRALTGVGTALCLIPMETLVNQNAPPGRRARDFACYAVAVALGIGAGPVIGLPLYPLAPRGAFALGGVVTFLAAGVVVRWFPSVGVMEENAADAPVPVRANLLGFGTAWLQGFLEGGMITFLSVYLLALGYTEAGAGGLMAALFTGVLLFQLPAGWLADRLGRARLVLGCHAVVFLGLLALPRWDGPAALGVELFFVGGCCAALYPLGLALLGERLPPAALGRANAWYLACNCAGSVTGPVLMGLAVDLFGDRALFAAGAAAVVAVVALPALGRRRRGPDCLPFRRPADPPAGQRAA